MENKNVDDFFKVTPTKTELKDEHVDKLLEMINNLFPEWNAINKHTNSLNINSAGIINFSDEWYEDCVIHDKFTTIHWFELCIKHLPLRMAIKTEKLKYEDLGFETYANYLYYNIHPVEYLYMLYIKYEKYEKDNNELQKRKEKWMNENAKYSQMLSSNIQPLKPDIGSYVKVNDLDIPHDFFEKEYNQIVEAYDLVFTKLDDFYKNNK